MAMLSNTLQYPVRSRTVRALAVAALALAAAPAAAQQAPVTLASYTVPRRAEPRDMVDVLRARHLLLPVDGVTRDQLHDTYNDARSGGRVHDAIDIHAPRGTHVLATTDGTIIKLHHSALGGITIYQLDDDGRTRYYYAHLDRYADGITEGVRVHRGEVIGYVGDTGNAAPGDCHLHFAIAILDDVSRWWAGHNLNPYDVFHGR
ncbi:MAG: M23 family metallopeptidase [Gemmatimonadetes bacterium]|nr:M23 family metallopeptidase [Gemmatimonadota bacterium]